MFHDLVLKTFWKNGQKSIKFPFFPIFVIEDPLTKLQAKKSKFYSHNFLGNIVVHLSQISKRSDENWGSLFDLKKGWWADDGRLGIG